MKKLVSRDFYGKSDSPWRLVGLELVEPGQGDGVLGVVLVVGHAVVLEPVPPQDLVRQVGRPHLGQKKWLEIGRFEIRQN